MRESVVRLFNISNKKNSRNGGIDSFHAKRYDKVKIFYLNFSFVSNFYPVVSIRTMSNGQTFLNDNTDNFILYSERGSLAKFYKSKSCLMYEFCKFTAQ